MTELTHKDTMSSREIARIMRKPHNDLMKAPVLDLFKVEENPNNYFFVTIKYHH